MQLTGRVWSQVTLYHPHSLCVPSHFVTCASFLLTIWEGLSVCRECALRTQRCKPQTKWVVLNSDSSHSSHITNLKFHNTGSPHRVVHTPLRLPLFPSSCPGQLWWPSSLASTVITGCLEEIIQRPHYASPGRFMPGPGHAHKAKSQNSYFSATYQVQLSRHSLNIIWYVTTVMLVNRISLVSHRCVIFLSPQPVADTPSVSNDHVPCCLQLNMAVRLSDVPLNENHLVPWCGCKWPWKQHPLPQIVWASSRHIKRDAICSRASVKMNTSCTGCDNVMLILLCF